MPYHIVMLYFCIIGMLLKFKRKKLDCFSYLLIFNSDIKNVSKSLEDFRIFRHLSRSLLDIFVSKLNIQYNIIRNIVKSLNIIV